jgi:hypothetical protein
MLIIRPIHHRETREVATEGIIMLILLAPFRLMYLVMKRVAEYFFIHFVIATIISALSFGVLTLVSGSPTWALMITETYVLPLLISLILLIVAILQLLHSFDDLNQLSSQQRNK